MRDFTKPFPNPDLVLHCQICGIEVGRVNLNFFMTETQYRAKVGTVDDRCTDCETTHGTFKELYDEYKKKTGDDHAKTVAFIIKHRTRADFNTALSAELDKREKAAKKTV